MQDSFQLSFDPARIAAALEMAEASVMMVMTDGRTATPIIQHHLLARHPDWTPRPVRGGSFDLQDRDGGLWKVKSATGQGIDFKPSVQIGFGRQANQRDFLAAWGRMAGFIVADVTTFPAVRVDRIPSANVIRWVGNGLLPGDARAGFTRYRDQLRPDINYP